MNAAVCCCIFTDFKEALKEQEWRDAGLPLQRVGLYFAYIHSLYVHLVQIQSVVKNLTAFQIHSIVRNYFFLRH